MNNEHIHTHGKLWSKKYVYLMISNFFLYFGDNLMLPVLPAYIKQHGATNLQIGIVSGVFFASSIITRIFSSRLSARLGRKTLLILSMIIFCVATMGFYFTAVFLLLILLRLMQGVGFGASTTLHGALVADIIPDERMGEGMGYFGLGITIAAALGPFLGAAAVGLPDFRWVFMVAAVLIFVSILLMSFGGADNRRGPAARAGSFREFLSDFIEPRAFYPAIFMLLIGLSMGGFFTYMVLFGEERNITGISLFFIITSIAEFFVRFVSGKVYDKKGMNFIVVPGAVCGILSCVVIAKATNLAMISAAACLAGVAFGTIFPVMQAVTMRCACLERRVAASATQQNFMDIGAGLGPLLFGAAAQYLGYASAFLLNSLAFIAMLAVVLLSRIFKWRNKYGLPVDPE